MAANDGHGGLRGLRADDTSQEAGGTDDVEGGDTEKTGGVEDTSLLEGGGNDRHG